MTLRIYGGTSGDFLTDPAGNWDAATAYSVFTGVLDPAAVALEVDPATRIDATAPVTDPNGQPYLNNQPVANDIGQVRFTVPDTHTDRLYVATFDPTLQMWRTPVTVWPADVPSRLADVEASSAGGLAAETEARQSGDTANMNALADEIARAVGVEDALTAGLAGKADLVAGLVPLSQIPPAAFANVYTAADITGMLSLAVPTGQGAICRVADAGDGDPAMFFLPAGGDPTNEAAWVESAYDPDGAAAAAQAAAEAFATTAIAAQHTSDSAAYVAKDSQVWNPLDHGIVADAIELSDAIIAAGSNQLSSASATFTDADIGKKVAVGGVGSSGGAAMTTSNNVIQSVIDAHTVTLQKTATLAAVAARTVTDAAITLNGVALTSATAAFTAADIGKPVTLTGAGEANRRVVTEQGAMTSGSAVLTAPYGCFPTSIVGQRVKVSGAGTASAPLYATVLSRASATSITLDTNAAATVAGAFVQAWDIADLVTVITVYTNATTVSVRNRASRTVSAANLSIGGNAFVYGTDELPAWQALSDLVNAGDTIVLPRGRKSLLGQLVWTISKPVQFRDTSGTFAFHMGATAGRMQPGVDGVTFQGVAFKALQTNGAVFQFNNTTVAHGYKKWAFLGCKWDGVQLNMGRIGAQNADGTVVTSQSDFGGHCTIRDPEITNVAGSGLWLVGQEGTYLSNPWLHHNGIDSNTDQLKVAAGSWNTKVIGGVCEYGSQDGCDFYDASGLYVDGLTSQHNNGDGFDIKWVTNQQFSATGRIQLSNVRCWNNGSIGLHANAHRTIVNGAMLNGNGNGGMRIADATDTNSTADPTLDPIATDIIAVGNEGSGVTISGPLHAQLSNIQAHNNTLYGVYYLGTGGVLSGVHAFNNGIRGVQVDTGSTGLQIIGAETQDTDGVANIVAGATFISRNGYGEEAAGIGVTPTLASWKTGTTVQNTSDGSIWRHIGSAWQRVASGLDTLGWGEPITAETYGASTTLGVSANNTRFYRVKGGGVISKIAMEVTASSGNIAVAVYRNNGSLGKAAKPTGAPLATSGSVACPAIGYAEVSLGATVTVYPGDWIAFGADNGTAAIRAWPAAPASTALSDGQEWNTSAYPPGTVGALTSMTGRMPVLRGVA